MSSGLAPRGARRPRPQGGSGRRKLNKADHESTKELQQLFGQHLVAIWQACGRYFVGTWSLCGNNLVAIIWSLFAKLSVARLLKAGKESLTWETTAYIDNQKKL